MNPFNKSPLVYVACPYWDESESVREYRRKSAQVYAYRLTKQNVLNYSPLTYSDAYKNDLAKEGYWLEHGLRMIKACDELHVLCLSGWEQSKGIKNEIALAKKYDVTIKYIQEYERVGFCGSRSLTSKTTHSLINSELNRLSPSLCVTHGEPKGVCSIVQKIAKRRGISLTTHFLNKEYNQGMFHERSKRVLEDCDFCVFIHDGHSQGTQNELELAIKMEVPLVYWVHDDGLFFQCDPITKERLTTHETKLDDFSDDKQTLDDILDSFDISVDI